MDGAEFDVETEDRTTGRPGRRARNRIARHNQLLEASAEIISEVGLDGLTMQAVAERVDCAVGTIYTYFDSKSSLVAALQIDAIRTLIATYHLTAEVWDEAMADTDEAVGSLVRLIGYGQLFVAGPDLHPREFELLQMLITTRERLLTSVDALGVLPHALTLINEAKVLIDFAVAAGALTGPTERDGTDSLSRTLRLAGALDGALLVANAGADPAVTDTAAFEPRRLAWLVTEDMLLAWGAPPKLTEAASAEARRLDAAGTLLPSPEAVR